MQQPSEPEPWPLLLSKLRRADSVTVSYAEVRAAQLEPELLVREGLAEYGHPDWYEPPGCECGLLPNLDLESRAAEGLVGVACVSDAACWSGWRWTPQAEVLSVHWSAERVFGALRAHNGLLPLELPPGAPAIAVGRLRRRGLDVAVVWMRQRVGFETTVLGLRQQLGGDGLIVVVPRDPRVPFAARERIAVLELKGAGSPHLELGRGLDELDPGYRARAAAREQPELEVDWVRLHFATEEKRHVLLVNGHDFVGFRKGDALFARLLLLAASRKYGPREGWRNKACLVGDFAARPAPEAVARANKALEGLRKELVADEVPGLTVEEQDAVLKAERGTEKVRLSVPPENITFDASISSLTWKVPVGPKGKGDARAARLTERQADGVETAMVLLAEARRLGAPGAAGDG